MKINIIENVVKNRPSMVNTLCCTFITVFGGRFLVSVTRRKVHSHFSFMQYLSNVDGRSNTIALVQTLAKKNRVTLVGLRLGLFRESANQLSL